MSHSSPARPEARPQAWTRRFLTPVAWLLAAVVLFVMTGCATIPTTGPVGKSDPLPPRSNNVNVNFQQFAPVDGASPESIIRGFIESGTGLNDDFQVARQYLAPALSQTWSPDQRTLVYRDTFTISPAADDGSYKLSFDLVGSVDAIGVLTPQREGATETLDMKLVQVDGEWRISEAPDGLVLTEANFQTLFSPFSLYFYDPSFTYGVPDVRWLAGRSSRTPTAIVKAMLAGPAPYLRGAVVSAFPNGIGLERDSVPVNNGLAKVGLTAQPLLETSVKQRQQMHSQLLVTLQKALSTVVDVQFLADDREVDMGGESDAIVPMRVEQTVSSTQVALKDGELATIDGDKVTAVPNMSSIAELQPSVPAISYNGAQFAFRSGSGNQIFTVAAGQEPVVALSGVALTPPSFAPNGWLWSAAGDGSGMVLAINPNDGGKLGQPVILTVPWLVGKRVTTLRISREGTRALVISQANGESQINLTGIFKSGDAPKELTEPLAMKHAGQATLGVWVSESSVAVVAPNAADTVGIEVLDLAAPPTTLEELAGLVWISAGSGVRNIHAQTAENFYSLVGNNWESVPRDVQQASYAG